MHQGNFTESLKKKIYLFFLLAGVCCSFCVDYWICHGTLWCRCVLYVLASVPPFPVRRQRRRIFAALLTKVRQNNGWFPLCIQKQQLGQTASRFLALALFYRARMFSLDLCEVIIMLFFPQILHLLILYRPLMENVPFLFLVAQVLSKNLQIQRFQRVLNPEEKLVLHYCINPRL